MASRGSTLDYELDVRAEVDMNVAMNHRGEFVEVAGHGRGRPRSRGCSSTSCLRAWRRGGFAS